jgi:preprotein translocase subunit SecY
MFNMFSGGAVQRMAIFSLNVMPYISASIIVQLMGTVYPPWEKLRKEGGEAGRKTLNQYTRYLTVVLAVFQSFGIAIGLQAQAGVAWVAIPGLFFVALDVVTLTGGTMFLMWLGEQITARGVGNGVSLIIFAGIVAACRSRPGPDAGLDGSALGNCTRSGMFLIMSSAVVVVLAIVFIERSQRRLLVHYPKRQQGNRMIGGESSFMPLKINTAGVIPPIFASSLLLLPTTVPCSSWQTANLPPWAGWLPGLVGALQHGQPAVPDLLRPADHLLLVLLHLDRVQSGGDGREPAQVRRLPAGHPSGQAHRRVPGLRADPPDRDRGRLHHRRLRRCRNW